MKLNGDSGARSDRFSIKDSVFREMPLPYPSIDEQEKIGEFFDVITNLITLHQRKCEMLQKTKKALLEKMFPQNGSAFPEVRFKGFTETWEQRKFVKKETIPCIIHANEENYRNQFLQNGDVIMADAAEDETVGKASEIVNLGSLKVVSGLHTIVCRPREKKQPYFLGYYINSQSFHSQLLPLMQGTKVSSLSRTNLSKTYVCYPTNPKEQAQIGNFFRNVDNLITLHQRELEKLQKLKSACLQKMFV
jgi:type I restriction enzyme S subunit